MDCWKPDSCDYFIDYHNRCICKTYTGKKNGKHALGGTDPRRKVYRGMAGYRCAAFGCE